MSSNEYVSPQTAVAYLLSTGLTKRATAAYIGITANSLYRIINAPKGFAFRVTTTKKAEAAYERRKQELAHDEKVRKELGL